MSVFQTMEAARTSAATTQGHTAVTAGNILTWTQMEDTVPADQGLYSMILYSLVMVSKDGTSDCCRLRNSVA